MQNIIQITKSRIGAEEVNAVNSREVYEYLGVKRQYADWIKSAIDKYGYEEGKDFHIFVKPANNQKDYIVTIDMAKELAMVSNTPKGREVRRYFIEMEKKAVAQIPQTYSEALMLAAEQAKKIEDQQKQIEADRPKVRFANAITNTSSSIDVRTFAQALYDNEGIKMGQNRLFKWFRANNYLDSKNKPYQRFIDRGYFVVKLGTYLNQSTGDTVEYTQVRVTGKGQMYFTNRIIDEVYNG